MSKVYFTVRYTNEALQCVKGRWVPAFSNQYETLEEAAAIAVQLASELQKPIKVNRIEVVGVAQLPQAIWTPEA
jgi:hypothetical protein